MQQFGWFDESPLKRLSEWARHRRVVAGRKVLAGLANGLRCLHISTQIPAVQTSDMDLSFIDVSPQRCGV
jgi:hypothetical protein